MFEAYYKIPNKEKLYIIDWSEVLTKSKALSTNRVVAKANFMSEYINESEDLTKPSKHKFCVWFSSKSINKLYKEEKLWATPPCRPKGRRDQHKKGSPGILDPMTGMGFKQQNQMTHALRQSYH